MSRDKKLSGDDAVSLPLQKYIAVQRNVYTQTVVALVHSAK